DNTTRARRAPDRLAPFRDTIASGQITCQNQADISLVNNRRPPSPPVPDPSASAALPGATARVIVDGDADVATTTRLTVGEQGRIRRIERSAPCPSTTRERRLSLLDSSNGSGPSISRGS